MATRFGYDQATEGLEEAPVGPSKTQIKQEALETTELAVTLLEIPMQRWTALGLADDVLAAMAELHRLKAPDARKRQAQFVGKLLRRDHAEGVRSVLEQHRRGQLERALGFPEIAAWRERLLASDAALTEFLHEHPVGEVRGLRATIRAARKEQSAAANEPDAPVRHGDHYRTLFQRIKAWVDSQSQA